MSPIKSSYMGIILLIFFVALAHGVLENSVASDAFADNAGEKSDDAITLHKRPSFFVGSRYGRSGAAFAPSKTRRLNVVPRNDRFFLGSRYGKRANEYTSPYEQDHLAASAAASTSAAHKQIPFVMSCVYTGLRNLYHCNNFDDINNIINQLTDVDNNNNNGDDDDAVSAAAGAK